MAGANNTLDKVNKRRGEEKTKGKKVWAQCGAMGETGVHSQSHASLFREFKIWAPRLEPAAVLVRRAGAFTRFAAVQSAVAVTSCSCSS